MRPLNRPMFRYGGPIKEGIMQGMQDGGLANNEGPRRAALVGNPVYPKGPDGRTGHLIPAIVGGGMAALRAIPAIYRGITASRAFAPGKLGTTARLKEFFTPAGALSPQVGRTGPMAKELLKGQTTGFKIGSLLRRNPLTLGLPAASLGAEVGFGIAKRVPDALREYGNLIVPFADPFKKSEMPEKKEGDTGELKRVDKIGAGEGTTGGSVVENPEKKKEIDNARIEKTKKRYYELMGIDKMKKDAAYDSLIDASKIVQEQGGDLKGAIKSGALQSQIINAISKNLDKSADIKRQIDAAILKGEIQKDIASADTTDKRFKEARTKQIEKATSASGQIAAIEAEKGTILGSQTAAILRADGIKYDDIIQDKLFNNFVKDNPGADEIDFMQAKGTGLDDGRYVIRGRLVEKKGNQVAFIV